MKVAANRGDAFVRRPDPAARAILVYGPDRGLIEERAAALVRGVVEDPADPFRVAELAGAALAADPARLADEAAAIAFGGGRRVVRVRGAGNEHRELFAAFLERPAGDALVVVEAGELRADAPLRRLFEAAANAAAVPCYPDEGAGLEELIRETLGGHGLAAEPDALAYLVEHLGGDRLLTRSELDKLALYMGEGRRVSAADAAACVGDSRETSLDALADAAAGGDHAAALKALGRLALEKVSPVTALRALLRHLQRLHLVAGEIAAGTSLEQAVARLRPPVYRRRAEAVRVQARLWPADRLVEAMDLVHQAELDCKATGMPEAAIAGLAVLRIAQAAASFRSGH